MEGNSMKEANENSYLKEEKYGEELYQSEGTLPDEVMAKWKRNRFLI